MEFAINKLQSLHPFFANVDAPSFYSLGLFPKDTFHSMSRMDYLIWAVDIFFWTVHLIPPTAHFGLVSQ